MFNNFKENYIDAITDYFPSDNLTVVRSNENPDFNLGLERIEFSKFVAKEVVNVSSSTFNGQSYYLHKSDVETSVTLFRGDSNDSLNTITSASKKERIKNNRTLSQLIKSDNKDKNNYHMKLLTSNKFSYITKRCGHKMEDFITSKLSRLYKKNRLNYKSHKIKS